MDIIQGPAQRYNSPVSDSSLDELSRSPMLLIFGERSGSGRVFVDIGVAEDVAVATAPDVSFHLGLSKRF